jgi:hypothetical protein
MRLRACSVRAGSVTEAGHSPVDGSLWLRLRPGAGPYTLDGIYQRQARDVV